MIIKIREWVKRNAFMVGLLAYSIGLLLIVQGLVIMVG
jgi:hypothetical protein